MSQVVEPCCEHDADEHRYERCMFVVDAYQDPKDRSQLVNVYCQCGRMSDLVAEAQALLSTSQGQERMRADLVRWSR